MATESRKGYLKAKIQIGNIKGPMNYDGKQVVFHHDDVPPARRERKHEVIEWKRKKIVGPEHNEWNISYNPNNPVCVRRQMENFDHDRSHKYEFNHRAETVDPLRNVAPIDRSTKFHISSQLASTREQIMTIRESNPLERGRFHRTLEMPVHPKLQEAPAWNVSTVLTLKEQREGLVDKTVRAKDWTSAVSATISERKTYVGPMKSVKLLQEDIRLRKANGEFSVKEPIRPHSTNEKPVTPRNHFLNEKPLKVKTQPHSGVWETSKVDGV